MSGDNYQIKICLIFPKRFEFAKFIVSIQNDIQTILTVGDKFYRVTININDKNYHLWILIIDDSDISFLFKLSTLIQSDPLIQSLTLILVGTCGAKIGEVDDVLYFTGFKKIDRGELKDDGYHMREDKSHIINIDPNFNAEVCLRKKSEVVGSSNFLINVGGNFGVKYYDMESYDYTRVCQLFKAKNWGCLRVISDIVGSRFQELTRSITNFDKLKSVVYQLLPLVSVRVLELVNINEVKNNIITLSNQMIFDKMCKVLNTLSNIEMISQKIVRAHNDGEQFEGKLKWDDEVTKKFLIEFKKYLYLVYPKRDSYSVALDRGPPESEEEYSQEPEILHASVIIINDLDLSKLTVYES